MARSEQNAQGRVPVRLLAIGYLGLVGFLALEATARQPGAASRLEATAADDGTTRRIGRAYGMAALATPVVALLPGPRLPRRVGRAGPLVQLAGLGLRAWSMRALGAAYSRTLRTQECQSVVDAGPYRLVRHPGYLGSILVWLGFGLSSCRPGAIALIGWLLGDAYARRIAAEERLLRRELAGYEAYAARTHRLVPMLW